MLSFFLYVTVFAICGDSKIHDTHLRDLLSVAWAHKAGCASPRSRDAQSKERRSGWSATGPGWKRGQTT